jgi:hypothetical protein
MNVAIDLNTIYLSIGVILTVALAFMIVRLIMFVAVTSRLKT